MSDWGDPVDPDERWDPERPHPVRLREILIPAFDDPTTSRIAPPMLHVQLGQSQQGPPMHNSPLNPNMQQGPPGGQQVGQQHLQQHTPGVPLPIPPPPPQNGQDQTLSGVLHFLQTEWRRYERDRNEWEVERAEMRARIALLEGERRSFENVKLDLMRRIKMLEYALRMERTKQLSQGHNAKALSQGDKAPLKEDNHSGKGSGSVGSSPRSEDIPLPAEQRLSISSLPSSGQNGMPATGSSKKDGLSSSWPIIPNGATSNMAKPPPGRDQKSRARSLLFLKQCLQEVNYLTSPPAMNPLPNRALITNSALPLSLPNLPPLEQVGFNGRTRKVVPESFGSAEQLKEADAKPAAGPSNHINGEPSITLPPSIHQPFSNNTTGIGSSNLSSSMSHGEDRSSDWKEPFRLEEHTFPSEDRVTREEDDEFGMTIGQKDADLVDEETSAEVEGGKIWRTRRTLRNHLDAVRAVAFHPFELCLATGGDDFTVKLWRVDPADLATTSPTKSTTEIEPQLTLRGHTGPITKLAFSSVKPMLYSASLDSTIRIWNPPPASCPTYVAYDATRALGTLVGHTDAVWDIALVRDDTMLLSCGADGAVKLWQLSGTSPGSLKLSWGCHGVDSGEEYSNKQSVGATALEPLKTDLKRVAVAFQDGTVKLYEIETGTLTGQLQMESSNESTIGQVNALVSHPTMPLLVTGHEDKHFRIFDIFTGQCTFSMPAHLEPITGLSIDAAGFSLVSGSHDCSIRFWDLFNTRKCTQETPSHREKANEGVLAVLFHTSLPFVASAGADGTVKLYASS